MIRTPAPLLLALAALAGGPHDFALPQAEAAHVDAPVPRDHAAALPLDLALAPDGAIYFTDSTCASVRKLANGLITSVGGPSVFDSPSGVAVAPSGAVLVADSSANRILRIQGGQVTTLAGTGDAGFRDGPAAQARFDSPERLVVDASGAVLVADSRNNCIRMIR
jgi:DNA-binding beta-propeller fold protein YncE